jgi:type IV pilus biogenesis protein CpaD/CtpE
VVRDIAVKILLLAFLAAGLSGCASSPSATPARPGSTQPARFDYERDDDLDQDLSRAISADSQKGIA